MNTMGAPEMLAILALLLLGGGVWAVNESKNMDAKLLGVVLFGLGMICGLFAALTKIIQMAGAQF